MLPIQARHILTPAQIETIETYPLYPEGLSGVSYDVMSGNVDVRIGSIHFSVTPEGRVDSPFAQGADGILSDQIGEIEMRIELLQRTVDRLTGMVQMLMTSGQQLRYHQR